MFRYVKNWIPDMGKPEYTYEEAMQILALAHDRTLWTGVDYVVEGKVIDAIRRHVDGLEGRLGAQKQVEIAKLYDADRRR